MHVYQGKGSGRQSSKGKRALSAVYGGAPHTTVRKTSYFGLGQGKTDPNALAACPGVKGLSPRTFT